MRDSEIEQWVLNEIRLTSRGRLKEVCVLSLSGVVNLKGTVRSRGDRRAAQAAAEGAQAVIAVINDLKVRKRILARHRDRAKSPAAAASGTFHLASQIIFESSQVAS